MPSEPHTKRNHHKNLQYLLQAAVITFYHFSFPSDIVLLYRKFCSGIQKPACRQLFFYNVLNCCFEGKRACCELYRVLSAHVLWIVLPSCCIWYGTKSPSTQNPVEIANLQCQERAKAELSFSAIFIIMTYEKISFANIEKYEVLTSLTIGIWRKENYSGLQGIVHI